MNLSLYDLLALAIALFVFGNVFDRLRRVNWKTTRAYVNLGLLLLAAVPLWTIWDAFTRHYVTYLQWTLLLACLAWLHFSRSAWRYGVPESAQTGAGALGRPELSRFR